MDDQTTDARERRRQRIERALKKSEERFRSVVEAAPNAMVMINGDGRIEMVNAQAERLFGYSRADLLGRPVEMLVPERFRAPHPGLRSAFFGKPQSRPMGAGRELYALRSDGSEFPVEIGLNPIDTEDGMMVLSAIVDISARKRQEERFRSVVEAAPNAMVMVNGAGRIEMVNAQAERVFGYTRSELLGHPVEILVPERFRGDHPDRRASFMSTPLSRPMGAGRDLFARRKDGSEFPVEIGLNPIETDEGPMVLSAVHDITERKRAEQALGDSEKRFRFLVEGVKDYGIFMLDAHGAVVSWNAGAENIKGYRADEIIGRHISCFYQKEDRDRGTPQHDLDTAALKGRFETEGWRVRKDGSTFWGSVLVTANYGDSGALVGFAKVVRDITERRRLEERFRRVVEAAPNAMVMINRAGRIEMVNAQAETLFGYERGAMLGQPVEMLVPERFRAQHPGLRGAFFGDPRSRPMGAGRDLSGLRSDGSEFPVEIGLNPIETEDGTMVLSAIVDISDRKQKEARIERALKEKDLLLAEIHHRVKNNLQVVHSLLDLQSAQISDRGVREMLRESQNRVQSMALIHQTLYQSKDFAEVDFRHFLETLTPTLLATYAVDSDRVSLHIAAADVHLPINIAVPCGLVVNELISNALKHAFPGGMAGDITAELSTVSAGEILLSVTDTGIGVPETLDIEKSTTLGLQLVVLLTDQLGGVLSIRRANPTRFEIRFPIVP